MTERWLAIAPAVFAFACAKPPVTAPAASPVAISNAPTPVVAPVVSSCPDSLGWLGRTVQLRYTEIAHGHFGYSELHADFHRRSDADTFTGVVTMTYRERPDSVPRAMTHALTLAHSEVTQLLTTMRDGIRTPPAPRGNGVIMVDSSRSAVISLDVLAADRGPDLHVQFFVDAGQSEPHRWAIRGCETDPPLAAQRAVHDAAAAFASRLDRDATIQRLMTP
ncbi:MAG: hypothetical protein H0T42_05825 [Deltaproteobacteria bacterium]|nr:hypothetical protein [Deltaproteobacteria bacterium]